MEIISEFPKQVIILKSSKVISGLKGKVSGSQKRMIDYHQTKGFAEYIRDLKQAKAGNIYKLNSLLDHGKAAISHFEGSLIHATEMKKAFDQAACWLTKDERKIIRDNLAYTHDLINKTIYFALSLSSMAFATHPNVRIRPTYEELPYTYIFRLALCYTILALDWAAKGGAIDANPDKIQNDMVDMHLVAFATFFDGLLTIDKKMIRIHRDVACILAGLFKCPIADL